MHLEINRINLKLHSEIAIQFRADSFFVSFGSNKDFYGDDGMGAKRYLDWLTNNNVSAYHVWDNQNIVGQIELGNYVNDATIGYVNLYYLAPSYRNKGLGKILDDFTTAYFKERKIKKILLSVSLTNTYAQKFYEKQGWQNLGFRFSEKELLNKKCEQLFLMQKILK